LALGENEAEGVTESEADANRALADLAVSHVFVRQSEFVLRNADQGEPLRELSGRARNPHERRSTPRPARSAGR
jgi:hypothetical protein